MKLTAVNQMDVAASQLAIQRHESIVIDRGPVRGNKTSIKIFPITPAEKTADVLDSGADIIIFPKPARSVEDHPDYLVYYDMLKRIGRRLALD